jgi:hypothetical protein
VDCANLVPGTGGFNPPSIESLDVSGVQNSIVGLDNGFKIGRGSLEVKPAAKVGSECEILSYKIAEERMGWGGFEPPTCSV